MVQRDISFDIIFFSKGAKRWFKQQQVRKHYKEKWHVAFTIILGHGFFIRNVLFLLIYSVKIEYVYNKNQMFSQLQQLQNRDIS